jgi:hypothetical protein
VAFPIRRTSRRPVDQGRWRSPEALGAVGHRFAIALELPRFQVAGVHRDSLVLGEQHAQNVDRERHKCELARFLWTRRLGQRCLRLHSKPPDDTHNRTEESSNCADFLLRHPSERKRKANAKRGNSPILYESSLKARFVHTAIPWAACRAVWAARASAVTGFRDTGIDYSLTRFDTRSADRLSSQMEFRVRRRPPPRVTGRSPLWLRQPSTPRASRRLHRFARGLARTTRSRHGRTMVSRFRACLAVETSSRWLYFPEISRVHGKRGHG